jgi:hypothetical protein
MTTATMTTHTTPQQQSSYERALARAHSVGLEITGQGRMRSTGYRFLVVPSTSEPGRFHLVTIVGAHLHCSCQAGQHDKLCQHRTLAHEFLVKESEQRQALALERAKGEQEEREEMARRSPEGREGHGQDVARSPRVWSDNKPVTMFR